MALSSVQGGSQLAKYSEEQKKYSQYILEAKSESKEGETLGEISLTYYKYNLNEKKDAMVIMIDQPEDNISNNHINKELITYLRHL